jgi:hypothetical protein
MSLDVEYVLPLRWTREVSSRCAGPLTDYLRRLSGLVDVTVVDGSDAATFARHSALWSDHVRHLPPDPWPGRNGKVAGVVTGVRRARHERVVIADDDVRYDETSLRSVVEGLDHGELVRPQNVFTSWPWHARWDTGRTLLNRALSHDHPGTFGVRRSCFVGMGGYDGDVLFENLELTRTVRCVGGRVVNLPGVFVGRVPPDGRHFRSQRVRQAYDDLAQPARLLVELAVLPVAVWAAVRLPAALLGGAVAVVLLAEAGRRRAGGAAAYPRSAALWALPWVAERSVSVWLAVAQVPRGGAAYGGVRVRRAATPVRHLRSRVPRRAGGASGAGSLGPPAVARVPEASAERGENAAEATGHVHLADSQQGADV